MGFAVLTKTPKDQCYEWVPYSSGDAVDPRMIYTGVNNFLICRMQRDGYDRVGQFYTGNGVCYASWGALEFNRAQSYPCQRLRIVKDCTIFWVPYTPGDPIHTSSVIGGHTWNDDVVYVTKFEYGPTAVSLAGNYVKGANQTTGSWYESSKTSATMMMIIVL